MEIRIKKFDEQLHLIKNELKNYEYNVYEAISIINNMHFYWNDGYTKSFFSKINKTTQDLNNVIDYLHHVVSSLETISTRYNSINSRIDNYFGCYETVINSAYYIIDESDNEEIANRKSIISDYIVEAEDAIGSVLSRFEKIYVWRANYDSLDRENDQNDFLGMLDNMPNEIRRLEQKNREVSSSFVQLKASLMPIISLYNSSNSGRLSKIIDNANENMHSISDNLESAYEYVISRREAYQNLFSEMANDAGNI